MIKDWKHGTKIFFTSFLKRVHNLDYRYWITEELNEEKAGIFLGLRTLRDGEAWWDSESCTFTPNKIFRAALVSYHLHRNPVYVPIDSVRRPEWRKPGA